VREHEKVTLAPDADTPAGRRLRLRYPARCSVCGAELVRGTEAWWDLATKAATCLVCGSGAELARELAGTAGSSGRQKYVHLRERRKQQVKGRFGEHLGALVLALGDDPRSTRAWGTGAAGEERLARFLERTLPPSTIVLHDRRIPGSRANIDHIVVASSGVWVIDAKLYRGKVDRRTLGPFWRPELAVFVGGRNRTKVVHGMARQLDAVRDAIAPDPLAGEVAVRAAVCFVASEWSLFAKPFEIGAVIVTWPQKLVERIGAAGALTDEAVARLANRLAVGLPQAARNQWKRDG
jgi:Nuclease-related domain